MNAPSAATSTTGHSTGLPVEVDNDASAMTSDSLGTGGKNPSTVANPNSAAKTHGDAARSSAHCSSTCPPLVAPTWKGPT